MIQETSRHNHHLHHHHHQNHIREHHEGNEAQRPCSVREESSADSVKEYCIDSDEDEEDEDFMVEDQQFLESQEEELEDVVTDQDNDNEEELDEAENEKEHLDSTTQDKSDESDILALLSDLDTEEAPDIPGQTILGAVAPLPLTGRKVPEFSY